MTIAINPPQKRPEFLGIGLRALCESAETRGPLGLRLNDVVLRSNKRISKDGISHQGTKPAVEKR